MVTAADGVSFTVDAGEIVGLGGLIGAGRHGARYARHLIQDIPHARLHAVCRQHPEQGLDVPGSEAVRIYGRTEELIADPLVDFKAAILE